MTPDIEILESGPFNSVQDLGRPYYLALGVSLAGVMDGFAARVANTLVGNPDEAACLEIGCFPFRLRFHRPTKIALTGADCDARLNDRALPPWWTCPVRAGDELSLPIPLRGRYSYLAVAGGIDVPRILGSRSTDMKTGFGGCAGRGLKSGDHLRVGPPSSQIPSGEFGVNSSYPLLPPQSATTLRVLAAAELDSLTEDSRIAFTQSRWEMTAAFNRTGARLEGARLSMVDQSDVFSYGLVPGLIQLPPAGQPIIQLAEANTCGGYPRIGTVIGPDLRLLTQTPAAGCIWFEIVDHATGVAALMQERTVLASLKQSLARASAA